MWNIDEVVHNFGHLQLFKYELTVHATKFLITVKDESNTNRLDQMTEQNIAKT